MKVIFFYFSSCLLFLYAQEIEIFYFNFAKEVLNTTSSKKLQDWMDSNKNNEIFKIEGFCDTVDTNIYNKKLASIRIENIVKILLSNDMVISKNLEKVIFGEDFEQDSIQANNRKVILYYNVTDNGLKNIISKSMVGDKLALKQLNFYNFSDKVLPKSIPVLSELLQIMLDNPTLKIQIQGHICCIQEGLYTTSTDRAKTVYRFLLDNGIDENRLSFKGFGSTQPIYPLPEKNEEQRVANRRVEILIESK